jgi:RES domain-containing protein
MNSVAMVVPSEVISGERNVLLNPLHEEFAKLRPGEPRAFVFDPRLR